MRTRTETIWITREEVEKLGFPVATISSYKQRGLITVKEIGKGRNGKPAYLYSLDSLESLRAGSTELYKTLTKHQETTTNVKVMAPGSITAASAALDRELARFTQSQRTVIQAELVRRSTLIHRFEALKIARRVRTGSGNEAQPTEEALQLLDEFSKCSEAFAAIYPSSKKTPSIVSADRWLKGYRGEDGLLAFLNCRQAVTEDDPRKASIHPDCLAWLWERFADARGNVALIEREIHKAARKRAAWTEDGYTLPSYMWIYRWRQNIPRGTRLLHEVGKKSYRNNAAPYIILDYKLLPREIYQSDHSPFDVAVYDDETGVMFRPSLTAYMDMRTNCIPGYAIVRRPSSRSITSAWINAVQRKQESEYEMLCGLNARHHYDNGKDYRSFTIEGKTIKIGKIDFEDAFRVELINYQIGLVDATAQERTIHSIPYNSRGKGKIERWFGTMHRWFDITQPGFLGHNTKDKPESWPIEYHQHKDWLAGKRDTTPLISFEELKRRFQLWLMEYHATPCEFKGSARKIEPLRLFNDLAEVPRMPTCLALERLAMVGDRRRIFENGINAFQKDFWYDAPELHELPEAMQKAGVEIRYNPEDLTRLVVYTPHGFLCEAKLLQHGEYGKIDIELIKEVKREERRRYEYHRDQPKNIAAMQRSALDHVISEREIEQVQLPIAVNAEAITQLTRFDQRHKLPQKPKGFSFELPDAPVAPPTRILNPWEDS